jgi:uncharacterized membrane protein
MFDDAFKAIARDRAGTLEVGIRLQKALLSLAKRNNKSFGESARIHAALALERTDAAALLDDDRLILRNLANELLPALGRVPLASSVEGPAGNG